MADSVVVVNNALCFLCNKFGKTGLKLLKSALLDFYDVKVVCDAKCQLIEDIEVLKSSLTTVTFPHVPRRRDGETRMSRELDDILTLLTFLDEQKLLSKLPRYVADNPDDIPPIRLYDSDLNGLITMIRRLADRVDEYSSVLSIVSRELQLLQARCADQLPMCDQQPRQSASVQPPIERSSADHNLTTEQPSAVASNVPDWAAMASTPFAHANRFDALRSADDDDGHSDATGQAYSFTAARSRRGRRRARQQSSTNQAVQQQQQQPPYARARLLLGKSVNTDMKISAAKQIRKKAVFCVDNVSTDCSVDDIKSFVSGLSVKVLTCYEVKPRRRRGDDEVISDRKAFRLCICDEDRNRLLDDSVWPDSVSISEWFFKSQQRAEQEQQMDKRRKVATDDVRALSAGGASAPVTSVATSPTAQLDNSSDETIVEIHMDSDGV